MVEALRHKEMREHNILAILSLIQRYGTITRPRLSQLSGLTKASITRVIQELAARGLVEEDPDHLIATAGRPAAIVRMCRGRWASLGIELRIDRCRLLLRDVSGQELARWERLVERGETPEVIFRDVCEEIGAMRAQHPHSIIGIGVGIGGTPSSDAKSIQSSIYLGWKNVDVVALLKDVFLSRGEIVPPLRVLDISSCAAQANYEEIRNAEHLADIKDFFDLPLSLMAHVQCGVGLGAGRPGGWSTQVSPHQTMIAIAHAPLDPSGSVCSVCGCRGCVDAVLGFKAVVDHTRQLGISIRHEPRYLAAYCHELSDMASRGDRRAQHMLERLADSMARVLIMTARLSNVTYLTIAGWPTDLGQAFMEDLAARVEAHRVGDRIILWPASLGDEASLLGAALVGAAIGFTENL